MEAERVLRGRTEGHRDPVLNLAPQRHRGQERAPRRAGPLAHGERRRPHDGDGMEDSLRVVGLDVAGVAHGAVGEGGIDAIGFEAPADHGGFGVASSLLDEVGDQAAGRVGGVGGRQQRGRAVPDADERHVQDPPAAAPRPGIR